MKLWIRDSSTPTHHIIYLTQEAVQNATYLNEFSDEDLKNYFHALSQTIDTDRQIKRLHYYRYLHLFVKKAD